MLKRTREETTCSIRNHARYTKPRRSQRTRTESDRNKSTVISIGNSLKIEPLRIPENPLEVGRAWREWIEDFEDKTSYFKIT